MAAKVRTCPKCGFKPERPLHVDHEDGDLVKIERRPKGKIATADKEVAYAELLGYARERGFKDGWAYYAAKELFGSAPRNRPEAIEPSRKTRDLIRHLNIKRAKAKEKERRESTSTLV
jgi:DNA repair protein RadD